MAIVDAGQKKKKVLLSVFDLRLIFSIRSSGVIAIAIEKAVTGVRTGRLDVRGVH